ncbi:MAG TPA: hypothetical protein VF092_06700 [Longimicrobium sp.]
MTIALLAFAAALLDCAATVLVLRDRLLTGDQRRYQLLFAWMLPFVGALGVIVVNRIQASQGERRREPIGSNPTLDTTNWLRWR